MALVIEFICDLPNGVHARPASLVETLCNRFIAAIEWRTGQSPVPVLSLSHFAHGGAAETGPDADARM